MDRRTTRLCAIAGAFALAILLSLACHPGFTADPPAGMSAPAPVKASFESAPVAGVSGNAFDWHPQWLRPSGLAIKATAIRRPAETRRHSLPDVAYYGPLHRRPPPAVS
jgi:hypothetical protein